MSRPRSAPSGAGTACSGRVRRLLVPEPLTESLRLALAFVGVGLVLLLGSRAGPRLDAGHPHLSRRVGPRQPGPACRRPSPTCCAPTPSISCTATSPPTPPSRSTTPRSAGIATTGTWARRSTTWPTPMPCAPSVSATSATSPPTPSPTTTSCPASSCSPAAPRPWGTRTGRPGSRRTWATPTRRRRRT